MDDECKKFFESWPDDDLKGMAQEVKSSVVSGRELQWLNSSGNNLNRDRALAIICRFFYSHKNFGSVLHIVVQFVPNMLKTLLKHKQISLKDLYVRDELFYSIMHKINDFDQYSTLSTYFENKVSEHDERQQKFLKKQFYHAYNEVERCIPLHTIKNVKVLRALLTSFIELFGDINEKISVHDEYTLLTRSTTIELDKLLYSFPNLIISEYDIYVRNYERKELIIREFVERRDEQYENDPLEDDSLEDEIMYENDSNDSLEGENDSLEGERCGSYSINQGQYAICYSASIVTLLRNEKTIIKKLKSIPNMLEEMKELIDYLSKDYSHGVCPKVPTFIQNAVTGNQYATRYSAKYSGGTSDGLLMIILFFLDKADPNLKVNMQFFSSSTDMSREDEINDIITKILEEEKSMPPPNQNFVKCTQIKLGFEFEYFDIIKIMSGIEEKKKEQKKAAKKCIKGMILTTEGHAFAVPFCDGRTATVCNSWREGCTDFRTGIQEFDYTYFKKMTVLYSNL